MTLSQTVGTICIVLVGIINTLPVIGLLGADRIASAYGVSVDSPELEILVRHRALLFGVIGGFVLTSVFLVELRLPALVLAGASMIGFLLLTWSVDPHNQALKGIVQADLLCLPALGIAVGLHLTTR